MSKNPASLKVGMSGLLRGRRYTVRGWAVYTVEIDGKKYYWTEFNVSTANGLAATLVFEETEEGPTWKWFTPIEPRRPITIAEAEAKKVGDTVEYEGRPISITLVDESVAEEIHGEPPGNVVRGEVARYFNADAGQQRMFVATWVGGKIEFYIGQSIGRRLIESAFDLPRTKSLNENHSAGSAGGVDWESIKVALWILGMLGFFIFRVVDYNYEPEPVFASPPAMRTAPSGALPVGIQGKLDGWPFKIAGRARTVILARKHRFQVHEYALHGTDTAGEVLLIQGWGGEPTLSLRLTRMEPPPVFTGVVAAGLRHNAQVLIGDRRFSLSLIFLTRVQAVEGVRPENSPWAAGELHGFIARAGEEWLFCRWTENQLRWYVGTSIAQSTILEAFGKAP